MREALLALRVRRHEYIPIGPKKQIPIICKEWSRAQLCMYQIQSSIGVCWGFRLVVAAAAHSLLCPVCKGDTRQHSCRAA